MGRRAKDLRNIRFGKLTVLERVGETTGGNAVWLCQCDCGKLTRAISRNLLTGRTKSCGCVKRGGDLTGRIMGNYKIIKKIESDNGHSVWLCENENGTFKNIRGAELRKLEKC